MATSKFQAQQPFHVLLTISLTLFLLLFNVMRTESSQSFSFTKFVPNQPNLILQGDALITSTGKLQLTKVEGEKPLSSSLGRALYSAPIRIWDSSTGKVASFVTSFSFIIDAPNENFTADGIAFFLAPPDTKPLTNGGFLGLFRDRFYNESYQTVAVEFDTCVNFRWDPNELHLGIDVNSIKSTKTASWGFANGHEANVLITYQASTQTLVASIVYPSTKTSFSVSDGVDLKSVLPEWVRVGFTATSGLDPRYIETHDVLSWSFASTFADSMSDALKENPHIASYLPQDFM